MTERTSTPEYEMKVEQDVSVPMPDGVELVVDVHRPAAEGRYPALLTMTPYGKQVEQVDVEPLAYGEGAAEFAMVEGSDSKFWAERGYVHVIADTRGCGKSSGEYHNLLSDQAAQDGHDLVEWMASQDWCTGKIGMVGISYLAIIQYLVAAKNPPHLEAIFPHDGWGDTYRDIMYHGGIQSAFFTLEGVIAHHSPVMVSESIHGDDLDDRVAELLEDESYNLSKSPMLREVLNVPEINPIWFDILVNREDNEFWQSRRPAATMDQIEVPVHLGSEMHHYPVCMHLPGAAHWGWENIQSEKKLAFQPAVPKRPFKEDYHEELLRWYDYHLKDIETGVMDEPPVKVWVRGAEEFHYSNEWPLLEETEWTEYHLGYGGRLRSSGPSPSSEPPSVLEYETNPPSAIYGTAPVGGEPDHLRWTSEPIGERTRVIGPITLRLFAALDTTDGHFIAVLKHRYPDGSNQIISRGWLKASHRAIDEARCEQWRPVHPHTDPEPVVPGEITQYDIAIQPIATEFEAEDRLELELWPSDFPSEDYYDETLLWGRVHHLPFGEDVTYEIYHDAAYPSHLQLPVLNS